MPRKTDKIPIADPFLDRRTKLLPCQKEMVRYWHRSGASIHSIAKLFKVSKRSIQFILFPERQLKNREDRDDRGGWQQYYDRAKNTEAQRDHRNYKTFTLKIKPLNPLT